jgi:uncharacterized protein (DUF697 family)
LTSATLPSPPRPAPLPAETIPGTAPWRRARAREIVRDHALFAAGATCLLVPGVNCLAAGAVQIRMLAQLARLFGRDFDESLGQALVGSFSLGFVHYVFSQHSGAAGWKLALTAVPVVGPALALAISPAIIAFFTHLLGEACLRHFEAGKPFSAFKAADLVNTPFAPLALHFIGP